MFIHLLFPFREKVPWEVASWAMHAKEWCEEMYLDWSWYTLTKPCVHNERRWCWEFQRDALGFNLYSTCIQLGSTAKAHCALWGLEVARERRKKMDSSWRIHHTNPAVHYEIWRLVESLLTLRICIAASLSAAQSKDDAQGCIYSITNRDKDSTGSWS